MGPGVALFLRIFFMRKDFFLALSAIVFVTSPLLGMKRELEGEVFETKEKSSTTLSKLKTEEGEGISIFCTLIPKEMRQVIVSTLSIKDMIRFSLTSLDMYALCEDPIHSYLEKNECMVDNPNLSLDLAINEYFSLFKDKTKTYTVTVPQLHAFLKGEVYEDNRPNAYRITYGPMTGNPAIDWTVRRKPKSFSFSIGGKKFQIFNRYTLEDKLETLRRDAYVTFAWKSYPYDPNLIWEGNRYPESPDHFYAEVVSCPSNTVVRDLSNLKYLKKGPEDIARVEYIRNYFQIEEIGK